MVFTSTTTWKPINVNFFQKVRNWILSVLRVSVCREKNSPWLRPYQAYISNWYVNGKVFTSTTTWEPKIRFFFSRKFEIEFDLCWRAEINIFQVGLTYMSTSVMHRRPFEGRHLVAHISCTGSQKSSPCRGVCIRSFRFQSVLLYFFWTSISFTFFGFQSVLLYFFRIPISFTFLGISISFALFLLDSH